MYFDTSYYKAMDSEYLSAQDPDYPILEEPIQAKTEKTIDVPPSQLGVGTNPFIHPTQGVNARLHDGASKMEIAFFGAQKGNKDRFTPESIGKDEREDIRNLLKVNKAKMSVHATVAVEGLSGFSKEGFNDEQRAATMREVEKAIDFAADASTGGAIVFHTGEWSRPISEQKFGTSKGGEFRGFEEEEEKAAIMIVDTKTGQINAVRKDHFVYEPEYHDVLSFSKDQGYNQDSKGNFVNQYGEKIFTYQGTEDGVKKFIDKDGKVLYEDDWVNKDGKFINPDPSNPDNLFQRIPKWDAEKTNFKVSERQFDYFEKKAKQYKERHDINIKPEELFFKSQLTNRVLQAKGSSLYHAQRYEDHVFQKKKYQEALKYYQDLDENLTVSERNGLMKRKMKGWGFEPQFDMNPEYESIIEYLESKIKDQDDQMRYIHEASASADAQAKESEKALQRMESVESYGLEKTASSIARLARKVYEKNQHKKDPTQKDLFLAPENWQTNMFGGHPEEMIKIVEASRDKFIDENKDLMGEDKAKEAAKNVIKSTIDVGHLNIWRRHFKRDKGESDKDFNNRFNDWMLKEVDKMHKKGILGHFHLADNMGYDDEHLTPGQGNAPIKDFVKKLKEKGYNDFIIEAGSFNPTTTLHDTWSYFGTPISSSYSIGNFRSMRHAHFPYKSTPLYIAGAYAPSNEFKVWSEVPLH